jgi:hypothetical protein
MTRRQKLIEALTSNPKGIRLNQVKALLKFEGSVLFNSFRIAIEEFGLFAQGWGTVVSIKDA